MGYITEKNTKHNTSNIVSPEEMEKLSILKNHQGIKLIW